MKKLALTLIGLAALSASAQTFTAYWTNGVTIYTNLNVGQVTIPLTSNAFFALKWQADAINTAQELTGANKVGVRDVIALAAWFGCEGGGSTIIAAWQADLQAKADAKAAIIRIRQRLNSGECTDAQLAAALTALGL